MLACSSMPHSEDAAKKLLDPYMGLFGQVFPTAWKRWERFGESTPDLRLQVNASTRAMMLNNFGASAAHEIFADMGPEIVLTEQPGFLLVIVHSELHVRLKKFRGRTCETSGIPTDQRELFETQQPLIGFPEVSNCVLGYVLKRDVSGISETLISCKTKEISHWKFKVPMIGTSDKVEALPLRPRKEDAAQPGISSTMIDERADEEGGIGG
jgi:hypothetical protein